MPEYLPRCAAVTTVGDRIGELYLSRYGVEARTMRNSSPLRDLPVGEVSEDGCAWCIRGRRWPGGTSS